MFIILKNIKNSSELKKLKSELLFIDIEAKEKEHLLKDTLLFKSSTTSLDISKDILKDLLYE